MGSKLAIAIPTYNRADILKENLLAMMDELTALSIPVYISDDSTDDRTKAVIEELKKFHPLLYYKKNQPGLGHDRNCVATLSFPTADYIWYLGDGLIIQSGGILKVLQVVETGMADFICCNAEGRRLTIPTKVFTSDSELLSEIGWHLTMSGATIYRRDLLELGSFPVSNYRNFPQLALIFSNFKMGQSKLYWLADTLLYENKKKVSYWRANVFSVFIDDLANTFKFLPNNFSEEERREAVYNHGVRTGIFSYTTFFQLRISGDYTYRTFLNYCKKFQLYTQAKVFFVGMIAVLPRFLVKPLFGLYKWVKS